MWSCLTVSVHLAWLHHHATSALDTCCCGSRGGTSVVGTHWHSSHHWWGHSAHHWWSLLWSLLLLSRGHYDWLHLLFEATCLVAVATADTDTDADDEWKEYKQEESCPECPCYSITSFFPFSVPFRRIPGVITKQVI